MSRQLSPTLRRRLARAAQLGLVEHYTADARAGVEVWATGAASPWLGSELDAHVYLTGLYDGAWAARHRPERCKGGRAAVLDGNRGVCPSCGHTVDVLPRTGSTLPHTTTGATTVPRLGAGR